jgi:hypothetical protein
MAGIQAWRGEVLASVRTPTDEADAGRLEEHSRTSGVPQGVIRRCDELEARRPALGITVAGANLMADRLFSKTHAKIMTTAVEAQNWPKSVRDGILRTLGRLEE